MHSDSNAHDAMAAIEDRYDVRPPMQRGDAWIAVGMWVASAVVMVGLLGVLYAGTVYLLEQLRGM